MQSIYKTWHIIGEIDKINKNKKKALITIEFLCIKLYNYLILYDWGFGFEFTGNKKYW